MNDVTNSPGFGGAIATVERVARGAGARAHVMALRMAAIICAIGALASTGVRVLEMAAADLADAIAEDADLRIHLPVSAADVDLARRSLLVVAHAEKGDESAAMQIGFAWSRPVVDPDTREFDLNNVALRLASAAFEPQGGNGPCCLLCGLHGDEDEDEDDERDEEPRSPDPLALVAPNVPVQKRRGCPTGRCGLS